MSETTTRGVRILVRPEYLHEQSDPGNQRYFFVYFITIENHGELPVQLLSRHWVITNGEAQSDEVRGPGVVGEQPRLEPGESFQYSSFCPLDTPVGTMQGSFRMRTDAGEEFDADIQAFRLAVPGSLN